MPSRRVIIERDGRLIKTWTGIGETKVVPGPFFILALFPLVGSEPKGFQVLGPGDSVEFEVEL